jgi:branched-chain amino acid transport system substrate-binding protein
MYRLYPAADKEIKVVSEYALQKGFRRVGAYCLANQAGEQAIALFKERMEKAGITVALTETFAPSQADFRQTLLKFKNAKVEALLITGYTSHYKPIFRQMIEADMNITVLGGVATPLGNMETELPISFLNRVIFPGCRLYYAPDNAVAAAFAKRAKETGITINYEVAYAFDCATTLMMAIDAAASTTPSDIAAAVLKVTPFEGVTGPIAFDADRDIIVDLKPCTWTDKGIVLAK